MKDQASVCVQPSVQVLTGSNGAPLHEIVYVVVDDIPAVSDFQRMICWDAAQATSCIAVRRSDSFPSQPQGEKFTRRRVRLVDNAPTIACLPWYKLESLYDPSSLQPYEDTFDGVQRRWYPEAPTHRDSRENARPINVKQPRRVFQPLVSTVLPILSRLQGVCALWVSLA